MKKMIFITFLCFVTSIETFAQINTHFFEKNNLFEMAPDVKKTDFESIPTKRMPPVDLEKLLQEDREIAEKGIGAPFRFGYAFNVDYTLHDGKWHYQADKRIWNIKIFSEHAYSLNFIFSELSLIDKAELYIFNTIGSMIYGPVTADENILQSNKIFLTDLIAGNEVVIQLIEPTESKEHSVLRINKVVHGYINTFQSIQPVTKKAHETFQGSAEPCHNNIACYYPDWEMESDGVALILLSNGTSCCTGSLLNNTAENFEAYILTAFHCVDLDRSENLTSSEISNAENWLFRFKYKTRSCNGTAAGSITFNSSNSFKAGWYATDFALIEFGRSARGFRTNLTFLGWDRSGTPPSSGAGIHHPAGDAMKISFENHQFTSSTWLFPSGRQILNGRWLVNFDDGVVQHGSSGSPLFDQNKRVVGQLHGNQRHISSISYCSQPRAEYGKFNLSWTGGGTNTTRLSNWLDPLNTGAATVNSVNSNGCNSITVTGSQYRTTHKVHCRNITLENATIPSGVTLELVATESITIGPNVTVQSGGKLELKSEGSVSYNSNFTVETGASFINY